MIALLSAIGEIVPALVFTAVGLVVLMVRIRR